MAKVKRRRRRHMRYHARPVESSLVITMPVVHNGRKSFARMAAIDGKLALEVDGEPAVMLSGIDLHTALHALGFVRLNDRCGWG